MYSQDKTDIRLENFSHSFRFLHQRVVVRLRLQRFFHIYTEKRTGGSPRDDNKGSPELTPISCSQCSRKVPQAHKAYSAPSQTSSYLSPATIWSKKGSGAPIFLLRVCPGRSPSVSTSYPMILRVWGGGRLGVPSTLFRPSSVRWQITKPEGPHPSHKSL